VRLNDGASGNVDAGLSLSNNGGIYDFVEEFPSATNVSFGVAVAARRPGWDPSLNPLVLSQGISAGFATADINGSRTPRPHGRPES
jgi:hypothetical protein